MGRAGTCQHWTDWSYGWTMSESLEVKEKLLKDSFQRLAPLSTDITKVLVDLRQDTHDVIKIEIRGMPAGQIVTDKNDSVTLARRLLPESLKYGKEPSTIVRDMEILGTAYGVLLMEVRSAIAHGSVTSLAAYMRKLDADNASGRTLPGDGHLFLSRGETRPSAEGSQQAESSPRPPSRR